MTVEILISSILSFLVVLVISPGIIQYFRNAKIVTTDVHKHKKPLVPHSAGVPVIFGIFSGLLLYVFITVFWLKQSPELVNLLASMLSILMITLIGFMDDINSSQVKIEGHIEGKKGLERWLKPLLTVPAALPLMAIAAGPTILNIPFVGDVNLGIIYPLVIVPIGVVGASNMVNMLGGFNGLEIGMGMIYTLSLGVFAFLKGSYTTSLIFLTTFASLLGMFFFNRYPAKILAGDSLTYLLGAVVAVGAITGNMQRVALTVMIPFLFQGALKFYSLLRLKHFASDLGVLQKNGTIKSKYGKDVYSLTHLAMNLGKLNEKQIVTTLIFIQIIFAVIPFLNIF